MQAFLDIMRPAGNELILDVGGAPDIWRDVDYRGPIVFLNLEVPDPLPAEAANWSFVAGDGCALTYRDNEFPIVFSNSVIEHVGDHAAFAREIRRVGRRYWVQTPNRAFPIEPHMNFPFFQFLPDRVALPVARRWPFSFYRRYGVVDLESTIREVRLLGAGELRSLFPDGRLWRERLAGLTKSFVVYRS